MRKKANSAKSWARGLYAHQNSRLANAVVVANVTVDRMERARIEASKMPLVDAPVDAKELVELVAAPRRRD